MQPSVCEYPLPMVVTSWQSWIELMKYFRLCRSIAVPEPTSAPARDVSPPVVATSAPACAPAMTFGISRIFAESFPHPAPRPANANKPTSPVRLSMRSPRSGPSAGPLTSGGSPTRLSAITPRGGEMWRSAVGGAGPGGRLDQLDQLVGPPRRRGIRPLQHAGGQIENRRELGQNRLLDRPPRDQTHGCHGAGLADAMGARRGLVLDGRVPPGIHVDDRVGGGQVQAEAACLQRDQEDVCLAGLKSGDALGARFGGGGAVQQQHAEPLLAQPRDQQLQEAAELAEHQRLVPL